MVHRGLLMDFGRMLMRGGAAPVMIAFGLAHRLSFSTAQRDRQQRLVTAQRREVWSVLSGGWPGTAFLPRAPDGVHRQQRQTIPAAHHQDQGGTLSRGPAHKPWPATSARDQAEARAPADGNLPLDWRALATARPGCTTTPPRRFTFPGHARIQVRLWSGAGGPAVVVATCGADPPPATGALAAGTEDCPTSFRRDRGSLGVGPDAPTDWPRQGPSQQKRPTSPPHAPISSRIEVRRAWHSGTPAEVLAAVFAVHLLRFDGSAPRPDLWVQVWSAHSRMT